MENVNKIREAGLADLRRALTGAVEYIEVLIKEAIKLGRNKIIVSSRDLYCVINNPELVTDYRNDIARQIMYLMQSEDIIISYTPRIDVMFELGEVFELEFSWSYMRDDDLFKDKALVSAVKNAYTDRFRQEEQGWTDKFNGLSQEIQKLNGHIEYLERENSRLKDKNQIPSQGDITESVMKDAYIKPIKTTACKEGAIEVLQFEKSFFEYACLMNSELYDVNVSSETVKQTELCEQLYNDGDVVLASNELRKAISAGPESILQENKELKEKLAEFENILKKDGWLANLIKRFLFK